MLHNSIDAEIAVDGEPYPRLRTNVEIDAEF